MKISKNLTLKEVIKSGTAKRKGIDNTPTAEHLQNLKIIAEEVFQPIREHFGVAIGISSGYRSEALNEAIGGSSSSQHCRGQALDIDADMYGKITNSEIFFYILNHLSFDQLIAEFIDDGQPAWVHVSYVDKVENRKQALIATKRSGRTEYLPYSPSLYAEIYGNVPESVTLSKADAYKIYEALLKCGHTDEEFRELLGI